VLVIMLAQRDVGGPWKISIGNGCDTSTTTEETLEQALARAMLVAQTEFHDHVRRPGCGQGEWNGAG
jgi:hypothetical protein